MSPEQPRVTLRSHEAGTAGQDVKAPWRVPEDPERRGQVDHPALLPRKLFAAQGRACAGACRAGPTYGDAGSLARVEKGTWTRAPGRGFWLVCA